MNSKNKETKQKMQFSKLHVIFADFIVFFVYCVSAILSFCDKMPISDISIAIITVYGAFATCGYFTQNCIRDCSINKLKAKLNDIGDMDTFDIGHDSL